MLTPTCRDAVSKVCFSGSPVHSLLALGEGKCLAGCGKLFSHSCIYMYPAIYIACITISNACIIV